MTTRTVRAEYPIEDSTLTAPHLRLLARGMLADQLTTLGVVAASDAKVVIIPARRVVVATVSVRTPISTGLWHPQPSASVCPCCHAVLSEVAA